MTFEELEKAYGEAEAELPVLPDTWEDFVSALGGSDGQLVVSDPAQAPILRERIVALMLENAARQGVDVVLYENPTPAWITKVRELATTKWPFLEELVAAVDEVERGCWAQATGVKA